jgi:hypothetical protein
MPISPEFQAKIDALTDEKFKANIQRVLNSPGKQTATSEEIFDNMVVRSARIMAERALWRQWTDSK